MTSPLSSPVSPRRRPRPTVIASYLCYVWGIILLIPTVVILAPLVSKPRTFMAAAAFLSIVGTIAILYFLAGCLLRRRRTFGAWCTGILIVLTSALQLSMHLNFAGVNMKPPWLIVNALLVILLVVDPARSRARDRRARTP